MRRKKTKGTFKGLENWYNNLGEVSKILVGFGGLLLIILGLLWLDLPTGRTEGRLPSIFDTKDGGSIWDKESSLPKLLSYQKITDSPITVTDVLCNTLYEQDLNVTGFGKSICYRPNYYNHTDTDYDCVCLTSV